MKKKSKPAGIRAVPAMRPAEREKRMAELRTELRSAAKRRDERVRSLLRGPDRYARTDLRNRIRSLSSWSPRFGGSDEHQWFRHEAQLLLEDLVGALDRLDDAEALLEGGGR